MKVGKVYITNEGYNVTIIQYYNESNTTIRFDNGFEMNNIRMSRLYNGCIKNPYHPSVAGKGYQGIGEYSLFNKTVKSYRWWFDMITRCYNEASLIKNPTYKGCIVSEEWLNYQKFAKWFDSNYIEGFVLDKDILIKGNKIYSAQTCAFVPQELNKLLISRKNHRGGYPLGVSPHKTKFAAQISIDGKHILLGTFLTINEAFSKYKNEKEANIKRMANLWKDKISTPCYEALMQYKIEIND